MNRFVLLLRGINVGKAKRLAMADLPKGLNALGFTDVETLLNSGNAVFSARQTKTGEIAEAITQWLRTELSFEVPVVVLDKATFDASLGDYEAGSLERGLSVNDPSRMLIAFRIDPKRSIELDPLDALRAAGEALWCGSHALYLHCPNGIADSALANALLDFRRYPITSRNLKTVLKLQQRLDAKA